MDAKKTVMLVVLFVVIVGAIYFSARKSRILGPGSAPPMPAVDPATPFELIDRNTLQVITKPYGEWQKLGQDSAGIFKNPDTGTYSMVPDMLCFKCGAKIPYKSRFPHPGYDPTQVKCPKCGKSPFPGGGR